MEEVENVVARVFGIYETILRTYDSDIQELKEKTQSGEVVLNQLSTINQQLQDVLGKLNKVVETAQSSSSSTQKMKKRPKRLQRIDSSDLEDSSVSEKEGTIANCPSETLILAKTFSNEVEPRTSSRPVRAAKLKVEANLKEQSLRVKLRRPGRLASEVNSTQQKIKEERESTKSEVATGKNGTTASETLKKLEATKRLSNEIGSDEQKDEQPPKKVKVDESLVILNNNEEPAVEISDDETDKMPPPAAVPPKKINKKKVSAKVSDVPKIAKIKTEKESLGGKRGSANSIQSINSIESEIENIKTETVSDVRRSESIGEKKAQSKKRGKKKKQRIIKEEKADDEEQTKKPEDVDSKADSLAQPRPSTRSEKNKNTSFESVYEDAVSENTNKVQIEKNDSATVHPVDKNVQKTTDATFVSTVEIPVANVTYKSGEQSSPQETFIVEKDVAASNALKKDSKEEKQCNDQTFVTSNGQHTTFIKNNDDNENKMPPMESNDATFNVNLAEGGKGSNGDKNGNALDNSILTEDESTEEPVYLPKPKMPVKGGKKEIFNPFIQSPVKKKVEAFEKHANTINRSPPPQNQIRQTRQTKQQITKENKEPQNYISNTGKTTPSLVRNMSRLLTPTQQNNITPNVFSHLKTPSSVSKIPNMCNLKQAKAPGSTKAPSLSNEGSNEDLKKTSARLQLEEKKKKREQKQQMATQLREAKEKERAEKLKKMMEEREEKARRKAMEVEQQKRQLEELNRNLKLQEERREAQKRAEKQKLLEMAEAAKKEREMMEAIKMQKAKEKLIQERKLLEQKKLMMKKNAFNFDMLNSEDSTDDEEKTSSKRPPPPPWSKSSIRQIFIERQSHLPAKIVDSFFSVQPMTPDLRQIFPTLDSRYLKRNSSAFWNTPPRYSQLPKY